MTLRAHESAVHTRPESPRGPARTGSVRGRVASQRRASRLAGQTLRMWTSLERASRLVGSIDSTSHPWRITAVPDRTPIDALRADHSRPTTPNLDALAKTGALRLGARRALHFRSAGRFRRNPGCAPCSPGDLADAGAPQNGGWALTPGREATRRKGACTEVRPTNFVTRVPQDDGIRQQLVRFATNWAPKPPQIGWHKPCCIKLAISASPPGEFQT